MLAYDRAVAASRAGLVPFAPGPYEPEDEHRSLSRDATPPETPPNRPVPDRPGLACAAGRSRSREADDAPRLGTARDQGAFALSSPSKQRRAVAAAGR